MKNLSFFLNFATNSLSLAISKVTVPFIISLTSLRGHSRNLATRNNRNESVIIISKFIQIVIQI